MSSISKNRVQSFRERSYFVVPGWLEAAELAELRRLCDLVLDRTRAESSIRGHTSPSVSLFADSDDFAVEPRTLEPLLRFAASPGVCALLEGLAPHAAAGPPRIKKLDYYHEQTRQDWDGDWHRDSQFIEADPERERALLLGSSALHLRVAFDPDDRLELVQGSHARWDTDQELAVRKGARRASADMPNATRIALHAGDACVFHAWAIHRATYRRVPRRRTLDALYAFGPQPVRRW